MTTATTHPLSEARAAELWDAHRTEPGVLPLHAQGRLYIKAQVSMLRATFDAGREHEREHADPHRDPRPWQDCTREDIRKDDLVETKHGATTLRIGVAHHQNENGDWFTEDGWLLTDGDHWPLRRIPSPTPPAEEVELPTEHPAHLLDVELRNGDTCAYLAIDSDGDWIGVDQDGIMRALVPNSFAAFTLPDGTRARRDGEHEDGTPRFIKEDSK